MSLIRASSRAMLHKTPTTSILSIRICPRCLYSSSSSSSSSSASGPPPASPLLLKLRNDLKAAIKTRDSSRLNVLRSILADVTNASKTSSPVRTDMHVLSLLRKRSAASKAASVDFDEAGRADLKEKEDAQILVLEEYAGGVKTISEEEVSEAVVAMRGDMDAKGEKVDKGSLMKKMIGPGGVYEGKNVDKAIVARSVQEALGGKKA